MKIRPAFHNCNLHLDVRKYYFSCGILRFCSTGTLKFIFKVFQSTFKYLSSVRTASVNECETPALKEKVVSECTF